MTETEKKTGFKMSEGDWTCDEAGCGNINYARRTECNRCKAEKPLSKSKVKLGGVQIGKHLAEKSKGLFSADDWQCATCGNVNWARRSDCNICHAPKFGKIEERTGAGGGFNERGIVEYNDTVGSDSEYDDFGRKKKKISSSSPAPEPSGEPAEEESGEEDDMGRYALDDSEGESSESEKEEEEEKPKVLNSSRSRKRSKSSSSRSDRSGSRNGKKSRSSSRSRRTSGSGSRSRRNSGRHKKLRRSRSKSRSRSRKRSSSSSSGSSSSRSPRKNRRSRDRRRQHSSDSSR